MQVTQQAPSSCFAQLSNVTKKTTFLKIFLFSLVLAVVIYGYIANTLWSFFRFNNFGNQPPTTNEEKLRDVYSNQSIVDSRGGDNKTNLTDSWSVVPSATLDGAHVARKRQRSEKGQSYILYWRNHWGLKGWGWKPGVDLGGCVVTYNRSKLKDAEAVVFHYTGMDEEVIPWKHYRDEDQIFVFFNDESPSYMMWGENRHDLSRFDHGFINLSMTYRSDSSIYYPFPPEIKSILDQGKSWVDEKIAAKSKSHVALWIVSNCDFLPGAITRMKISDELLKAGLPVHRYGKCFNNKHVINNMDPKTLNSYKFYLAFENALHCKDYMTEKFWIKSIQSGRVPVVWGPSKDDVTRLAPTKSFIHYEDFDSPSSLASYLLYLNGNDTAYREYFKWAEDPDQRTKDLVETTKLGEKKLCEYIKKNERRRIVVKSITNFYLNDSRECFQRKTIF